MADLMRRFSDLFRAKLTRALSDAEQPEEMLELQFEEMQHQIQQIRRGIADVATARARLQTTVQQLQSQAQHHDAQAQQAVEIGREDLARMALSRKLALEPRIISLSTQIENLYAQQERLIESEAQLSTKVAAFRSHKEALVAEYRAAEASAQINEVLTGLSSEMGDVQITIERIQGKIEGLQARTIAIDELSARGILPDALTPGGGDEIDNEMARLRTMVRLEEQLRALQAGQSPKGQLAESSEDNFQ